MKSAKAIVAALLGASVVWGGVPSLARDPVTLSFDIGDVETAYSDGYWDNHHRWHNWRNAEEAREFQRRHVERYVPERHTKVRNNGLRDGEDGRIRNPFDRDQDRDNVPETFKNGGVRGGIDGERGNGGALNDSSDSEGAARGFERNRRTDGRPDGLNDPGSWPNRAAGSNEPAKRK